MKRYLPLVLAAILFFPGSVYAGEPMQAVQKHVNRFLDILRDPELKKNESEQIEKLRIVAKDLFDFAALSMRSLGKTWKSMSNDQKQDFVDLFSKLLERTYMDKIREYNDEQVLFDAENMLDDDKAEVPTKIVAKTKEIPILYRLYKNNDDWRVYDVLIENVSLVKNYRTQFGEYLSNHSMEELIEHLREMTASPAK